MKPIDFRNETFESLQGRLCEKREAVWRDWQCFETNLGPEGGTTREVALFNGRDLIAFRPRCTELYQLGVLMLVDGEGGERSHEGKYRLRTTEEWQAWFYAQRNTEAMNQQQLL